MAQRTPDPVGDFARYREIIPDWDAFVGASRVPAPTTIRVNTLRSTTSDLCRRFEARGIRLERVPWIVNALVADPGDRIGAALEHWLGHYYVQEAVQMLPVIVLDPQPGERILDLCAAPGGKSTQIASHMRECGLLVANEPNGRRQPALLTNLNRLGVLNAAVTEYRGESFPLRVAFDRVLVDAPCTGEGTRRRGGISSAAASAAARRRLSALQRRLVVRGYDLVRPGGTLVYSTCTFAPEENEAVIAHLLRERPARLVPIGLPIPCARGLSEWDGQRFGDVLRRAIRLYPHQLRSGGGFVACIERPE